MGLFDVFKCAALGRRTVRHPCRAVNARRPSALADALRRRETPQEQVRRWQRTIRSEMRGVDRQILGARGRGGHSPSAA